MKNAIVLVLDFINDIVHEKGLIARSAARIADNKTLENANSVIAWARKNDILVAHVKVGFTPPNYPECPASSPIFSAAKKYKALALGEWGTDFHEKMDVQATDPIIIKHRVNPFYNTDLETILSANNIDTIILTGTATNMAVEAAARDAHDRDYQVIVVKDACETASEEAQQASLAVMERFCKVITSAECDILNPDRF